MLRKQFEYTATEFELLKQEYRYREDIVLYPGVYLQDPGTLYGNWWCIDEKVDSVVVSSRLRASLDHQGVRSKKATVVL